MTRLEGPALTIEQAEHRLRQLNDSPERISLSRATLRAAIQAATTLKMLQASDQRAELRKSRTTRTARIQARRLESAAKFGGDFLSDSVAGKLKKRGKAYRRVLAPLRTADAMIRLLSEYEGPHQFAAGHVAGRLTAERPALLRDAEEGVRRAPGLNSVLEELNQLEQNAPGFVRGQSEPVARQWLSESAGDIVDATAQASIEDVESLHDVRLLMKRARYTCEWVSPTLGPAECAPAYAWIWTAQRWFGKISDASDLLAAVNAAASYADKRSRPKLEAFESSAREDLSRLARDVWTWWDQHAALVTASLQTSGDDRVSRAVDELVGRPVTPEETRE